MYAITWSPSCANRMRSPACTTGCAVEPMAKQPQARASAAWATAAAAAAKTTSRRSMGPPVAGSAGADAHAEVALRVGTARHERDGGARQLGVAGADEAQRVLDGDVDDRDA